MTDQLSTGRQCSVPKPTVNSLEISSLKDPYCFRGLTAIAGAAQAQSTVTLYGVADVYAGQKSTTVGGTS
jgi:hypothetical protein